MKISVIAIFYNSASYVKKCVDSILLQEGDFDLELVAVDDCSRDNTYAILMSYSDVRLKVVRHENNSGISVARNTGIKNSIGDAFYFIDGDDFLPKGALLKLAVHFSDDVDWVQGGYAIQNEHDEVLSIRSNADGVYDSHKDIVTHFGSLEFIYTHNRLINAKWKKNLFPVGKAHEDRFWNVCAFPELKKVVNVSTATYNYITHPTSFSNKSRGARLYLESAMELLAEMDKLEACWKNMSDTFLMTAIEKNLYLWKQQSSYRKEILKKLRRRSQSVTIDFSGFPRFTKYIHLMIAQNYPNCLIEFIAGLYRNYVAFTKKVV